jgi:hypothetical protein
MELAWVVARKATMEPNVTCPVWLVHLEVTAQILVGSVKMMPPVTGLLDCVLLAVMKIRFLLYASVLMDCMEINVSTSVVRVPKTKYVKPCMEHVWITLTK